MVSAPIFGFDGPIELMAQTVDNRPQAPAANLTYFGFV